MAAANSALQRARATMQSHLPPRRAEWSAREPTAEERALLEQFIEAPGFGVSRMSSFGAWEVANYRQPAEPHGARPPAEWHKRQPA